MEIAKRIHCLRAPKLENAMRILPILTSILVALALYAIIMERDALVSYAGSGSDTTTGEQAEAPVVISKKDAPVSVVAITSIAQDIESGIVLRGRTESARNVTVRSEINGLVISEPLRKGIFVDKDQVLCELDTGTRNAQLAEAKARLAEAEANNTAAASLSQKGFTSETAAIGRLAQLESAMAMVEQAEKELSRLQIRAPFSGLLESDTAELGELLQPGSPCATVIALDPIKLVGFVPESGISKMNLGATAGARLVTGEELRGFLTFLSRSADPLTRTFRVEVTVPNKDQSIRDGATAEIYIAFEGDKAHLLPQAALTLNDDGEIGVRAAVGDVARFMAVDIIRDTAEGILVAGLPDSLDVIVVGQEYVIDGRTIAVTKRENLQ